VEKRKQYIADHADFNRQDTFAAKEGRDGDQRLGPAEIWG